ncbi:signal recognition particle 14kD protein-domain-containing protein [Crucibulum laeve]|uniref:Signal recognition particle subunit SRP14 n=1 Tax=Crucibulum laeve TaxID=68775 RepID=A0A5C3M9U5_9AGAR|nr:signal recognition particle 14kD protein-domain-containing protein [Crucibulum laeve]
MQLVDNNTFLEQLTVLFESTKGSIWLTHKRLTYDGEDATMKHENGSSEDSREYPCLLRVTDGEKAKFSTHVEAGQLDKFHAAYGSLLKASMTTLRKRDKKREKQRAEQAARRKKKMTEPVAVDAPKRGNGRRRRQRQVKAVLKQQGSQKKLKEREEARIKAEVVI